MTSDRQRRDGQRRDSHAHHLRRPRPVAVRVVESAAGVRDSTDGRWGALTSTFATQAWLDASWRISTAQAPSVAACGATREEAVHRLNSERLLSPDHVSAAVVARTVPSGLTASEGLYETGGLTGAAGREA